MSQFRQFWIDYILNADRPSTKTAYVHEQDTEKCHRPIHVIEYSAYESAQKEIEQLRSIFSVQLDILEQNKSLTAALKVAEDALGATWPNMFNEIHQHHKEALDKIQKIKKGLG